MCVGIPLELPRDTTHCLSWSIFCLYSMSLVMRFGESSVRSHLSASDSCLGPLSAPKFFLPESAIFTSPCCVVTESACAFRKSPLVEPPQHFFGLGLRCRDLECCELA